MSYFLNCRAKSVEFYSSVLYASVVLLLVVSCGYNPSPVIFSHFIYYL